MDQKLRAMADKYFMAYWCEDNPELRETALAWNAAISEEAKKLHQECIIIDMCSFFAETYNWQLAAGRPTALNITVPQTYDPSYSGVVEKLIEMNYVPLADPEHFMNILTTGDILEAKRTGKVGLIFGAQSCDFVRGLDLNSSVEIFARMGLRVMQIAYHSRSFAADGCDTGTDCGLSAQGRALIRAMERSHVTVDLSHVGCRFTLEALDMAQKPMIFSHSNPKAMFNNLRNITDEQAKKCAATNGVVGVVGFAPLLCDDKQGPSIQRFVDTIAYYADLLGIDHVGFGLDSNAEPGAYKHSDAREMAEYYFNPDNFSPGCIEYFHDRVEEALAAGRGRLSVLTEGLHGIANYPNIVDALLKRGFSREDVKKVMGGNFLRVFKDTWAQ